MNKKKKEFTCSKTKLSSLIILLYLLFTGCAVPFETGSTLDMGESEMIIGFIPPLNVATRANLGVSGYTDIGIGLEAGVHLSSDPVFCAYVTAKQKILTLGTNPHYNLLLSGAYGVVSTDLNPENVPYYHYTLLLGMEDSNNVVLLGIGILQDPRFSWKLMHEEFSKETYIHALIGVEAGNLLFQIQTVHKKKDYNGRRVEVINFGLGRRF